MEDLKMDQAQLIRSIEQLLDNLMSLNQDLACQYEDDLYSGDDMDEPIIEKFTPELLKELEEIAYP
jgi:hypothetical protein